MYRLTVSLWLLLLLLLGNLLLLLLGLLTRLALLLLAALSVVLGVVGSPGSGVLTAALPVLALLSIRTRTAGVLPLSSVSASVVPALRSSGVAAVLWGTLVLATELAWASRTSVELTILVITSWTTRSSRTIGARSVRSGTSVGRWGLKDKGNFRTFL